MYETCNNSSKNVEFREIWSRLETMDEVEIYRDIRCMRKCQRMEWKAKTIYANQENHENHENLEKQDKSDNQESRTNRTTRKSRTTRKCRKTRTSPFCL